MARTVDYHMMTMMMMMMSINVVGVMFISIIINSSSAAAAADRTYINLLNLGAKSDGETDSSLAFQKAWASACSSPKPATVYLPTGRFLLSTASFDGQHCSNNAITFLIDGTLIAPSDYQASTTNWIKFERVTGVSIIGGTLDGQGTALWACKASSNSCPTGATTLGFYNSRNIGITGLSSLNSQMFHIVIDACQNANLQSIKVSASGSSPNTDGIHIESSSGVTILNSRIATGDDCISIGPGASNLWIEGIACGPGHGISIGSLGWGAQEPGVQNVTVKTVTFTGTENGARIKTWARASNGFVRGVVFQHMTMVKVDNPVIIDQNYCPGEEDCPHQVSSGVRITDVAYEDIQGTSATAVGVKLDCSQEYPCSGIKLDDIKLSYNNQPAQASCINALGTTSSAGLHHTSTTTSGCAL